MSHASLVVSMGDPAGIGPDLLVLLQQQRSVGGGPIPEFAVLADPDVLAQRARQLGVPLAIHVVRDALERGPAAALRVIPILCDGPVVAGRPDPRAATAILGALQAGVAAVHEGKAAALVTLPIAKHVLHAAGFRHPGHTEYLGTLAEQVWGATATPVMMLVGDDLRVVPVTVHVPISAVPGLLTTEKIVATARITTAALRRDFGVARPRLAFAGLNPHAGENRSIGHEDADVIAPAVALLAAEGHDVFGPVSADTLFHPAARLGYDACIAMYHDQALIPLKTLAFDRGVNVTLGLPFVRTSPDHGTAFDIAGTGRADPSSFIEALKLANMMAERRAQAAT